MQRDELVRNGSRSVGRTWSSSLSVLMRVWMRVRHGVLFDVRLVVQRKETRFLYAVNDSRGFSLLSLLLCFMTTHTQLADTEQGTMSINITLSKAPPRSGKAPSPSSSSSKTASSPINLALEPSTTLEQLYKEAAAKTRVRQGEEES